jgi:hypothetical protein
VTNLAIYVRGAIANTKCLVAKNPLPPVLSDFKFEETIIDYQHFNRLTHAAVKILFITGIIEDDKDEEFEETDEHAKENAVIKDFDTLETDYADTNYALTSDSSLAQSSSFNTSDTFGTSDMFETRDFAGTSSSFLSQHDPPPDVRTLFASFLEEASCICTMTQVEVLQIILDNFSIHTSEEQPQENMQMSESDDENDGPLVPAALDVDFHDPDPPSSLQSIRSSLPLH